MDEKKTEHSKPWGSEYIEQAKALRLKVALVEEAALPNKITLPEELMKSWRQHVDLIKQVYTHQNPEDNIKVEILEYYPRFKPVCKTSFPDIESYIRALDSLGWPYKLDSEQVGICHYCDAYYYDGDGEESEDDEGLGIGFCTLMCLENYEIKCEKEADHLEYMMEIFPDQYELIGGKIYQKAPTPQQQEDFKRAWERAIEYQKNEGKSP